MRYPIPAARSSRSILFVLLLLTASFCAALLAASQSSGGRFDMTVRGEMFAGMSGDSAAMDRAMKICEQALAKDPGNPEALVWHGSGLIFLGGQAIRAADYAKGKQMMVNGLREMDEAVEKMPGHIEVLIPRGATLLEYSKHDPSPERARATLEKALGDYEKVLALQKAVWQELPMHSRGELLSGLAEGWLRAGDASKARTFMELLVKETRGSRYAARAQDYLKAANAQERLDWHCIGCHAGSTP